MGLKKNPPADSGRKNSVRFSKVPWGWTFIGTRILGPCVSGFRILDFGTVSLFGFGF
jgi:hypothetical protein